MSLIPRRLQARGGAGLTAHQVRGYPRVGPDSPSACRHFREHGVSRGRGHEVALCCSLVSWASPQKSLGPLIKAEVGQPQAGGASRAASSIVWGQRVQGTEKGCGRPSTQEAGNRVRGLEAVAQKPTLGLTHGRAVAAVPYIQSLAGPLAFLGHFLWGDYCSG